MSASAQTERDLRDRLLDEAEHLDLGNAETFWRVASLCRDPRADAHDVALEIQRDDGFAANVLRLANSVHFASSRRIGDVPSAVARLGFEVVEGLAVSIQGARLVGCGGDSLRPFRRELHRHAIRTGLTARMIAAAHVDQEQALAAGLVHNLGLSVVSLLRPDLFRRLLDAAAAGRQLDTAVDDLVSFTHAELGGMLAERWRYPRALVQAITDHDSPDAAGLSALIQVADRLAREAGVGVEAPAEIPTGVAERAGLDLDDARSRVAPLFQVAVAPAGDGTSGPTTREGALAAALDELA